MILLSLFVIQSHGTERIGFLFGPVMIVWFVTIGLLGARWVLQDFHVLAAFDPTHGLQFFADNGFHGFVVFGSVFLVVTGGEALYADMGHFGPRPIRLAGSAWCCRRCSSTTSGQGAMLINRPAAAVNPFYLLAPRWSRNAVRATSFFRITAERVVELGMQIER